MTIEDHTSKTKTGSRANRDSPCDTGTPAFPLPPTATVGFQRVRQNMKSNARCNSGRAMCSTCLTRAMCSIYLTRYDRTWLCNHSVNLLPCEEAWGQRERAQTWKTSLPWNTPSPEDAWQFRVGRTQMSCYSCTAARPTHNASAGGANTEQGQRRTHTPWAALEDEPIWIAVSFSCRKDYCLKDTI